MTDPSALGTTKSIQAHKGDDSNTHDRLHPNGESSHIADSLSPTAHSPQSDSHSRTADMSTSESDNEASMGNTSSPKSLPLKRGAWSPQEDEKLVQLVETMQPLKWVHVAQEMRSRTSKQCRERYHNYLKPTLSRTPISKEEGRKIEELVAIHGKRWAEISRQLPGRSDNAIKNWWNAGINRRRASQDHSPSPGGLLNKPQSPSASANGNGTALSHPRSSPIAPDSGNSKSPLPPSNVPLPVQPTADDRTQSPSMHVPPPVQVLFSSMYSEPNSSRMHSPMYYPPSQYPSHIQSPQTPPHHQPHPQHSLHSGALPMAPHQSHHHPHHPHHHHHHHPHGHGHASASPYPLTSSQRADSRAESQARLSVTSLSSISSRSNSVVEDYRTMSPAASPPPQPYSSGYSHSTEDPSQFFSRLRQSSDLRRQSMENLRPDATSLSHYSIGNAANQPGLANSRRSSVQPYVPAEMAPPPGGSVPPPRQSRLSIPNLMNH